ncbi:PepSY domain-containing protein [Bacillus timonensis]|uniref:PepSY domain-containing protein n=1 Tax=Bacillus timonensis TaxID=1033734 RepID=UPI0002883F4B|nr:PepSY domain-containing protein [Bacillus timonensis]
MKKKLVILGIVGTVVLGGAVGVSAIAKEAQVPFTKAKEIATQEVNGAQVEELELDRENGELVYEVELTGAHDDAEVVINATTGKVVKVDDDRDDERITSQASGATVKISKEQAISIATKDTPGKITEIELDDDGYYEIEMKHEGKEVEMKISVVDGTILKKEIDDDDDYNDDQI